MADHRTYTICSGFRTGSLPACWRMYHSRQSCCFMVARYGQVSWSSLEVWICLNMYIYNLYIYSLLRSLLGTLGMMAKWSRSKSYYCQLVYLWNPLNMPTSINVSSLPVVYPLGTSPFFPPQTALVRCLGDGWPNGCISSKVKLILTAKRGYRWKPLVRPTYSRKGYGNCGRFYCIDMQCDKLRNEHPIG